MASIDGGGKRSYIDDALTTSLMALRILSRYILLLGVALPCSLDGQAPVDSALARYIASIRAIDDHAHPMRFVAPGTPADTEFDALPLDGIPAFELPNRLKADDPIWRAAQQALYGVRPDLAGAAYHSALKAAVAKAASSSGVRVGARPSGDRSDAGESYRDGRGARGAAISVDRVH